MSKFLYCAVLLILATPGCHDGEQTQYDGRTAQTRAPLKISGWGRNLVQPAVASDNLPGYAHSLSRSAFQTGGNVWTSLLPNGYGQTHEGQTGSAVEFTNGFFMARPHSDSPASLVGPFTNDPNTHHARVMSYFQSAGLPAAQVGPLSISTDMEEVWERATEQKVSRRFAGYTSIITRQIDGVPVVGSRAWAQFNKNDEAVAEEVWWPELPSSLHSQIAAFQTLLQNADSAAALRAKLPTVLANEQGWLTVHHSEPVDYQWYATVTFDVAQRGGPHVASLDITGEIVLFHPEGQAPNAGPRPKPTSAGTTTSDAGP